jgi:hypothetical protein
MLETIRNCGASKAARILLLAVGACALASCAKDQPELVSSGERRESALPWNKQEKWEGTGQFGGFSEQMQGSRR